MAAPTAGGIVPAQLGFLAIFNPSLGNTDETIDDQIVYYASVSTQSSSRRRRRARARPLDNLSQEERHERLRQIGLAQGMVSFGRDFSDGAPVDSIDTEKSRVIAHELEPGWWILASVDLNRVPLPPRLQLKAGDKYEEQYEYTSRDMKPAALLTRDLLRAHSIFLLHHASSLSSLFVRSRRSKFVALLTRYWDLYLSTWNVMLHGNPAREIYGGINMAASGELGVGVGEEDRGSGEREVLEGLVRRSGGLVDLVVSKFGDGDVEVSPKDETGANHEPWLGSGREPEAEDGAIFLGVGALSRKSLRDVTKWMEDIYSWGDNAYGVIDSPISFRRPQHKKTTSTSAQQVDKKQKTDAAKKAVKTSPQPLEQPESTGSQSKQDATPQSGKETDTGNMEKMVSILTLGYGSYWSFPGTSGATTSAGPTNAPGQDSGLKGKENETEANASTRASPLTDAHGHFLIGLKGVMDEHDHGPESEDEEDENNPRNVVRTLHIELDSGGKDRSEGTTIKDFEHPTSHLTQSQVVGNMPPGFDSHDLNKAEKLRVVVYVNKPFIFTFLFRLRTDSLTFESMYKSLHHQLAPLKKHLLASTRYRAERPDSGPVSSTSIHDLVWDPPSMTIQSTVPNIPDGFSGSPMPWSIADAVNTHLHILNIHAGTRSRSADLERTQKTNRGWWIVWTRVLQRQTEVAYNSSSSNNLSPIRESISASASATSLHSQRSRHSSSLSDEDGDRAKNDAPHSKSASPCPAVGKEIFLIRRASDHIGFRRAADEVAGGGGDGAGRLVQGIGVDTRRYVEELLTLL